MFWFLETNGPITNKARALKKENISDSNNLILITADKSVLKSK